MKNNLFSLIIAASCCTSTLAAATRTAEPYEPTWTSLRRHSTPGWLEDAKVGVYCHWGLGTIRLLPGSEEKHLREIIPEFTAEAFDADARADLFVRSGAEFAGPVAWHGSVFQH